jgi:hypothetical protein
MSIRNASVPVGATFSPTGGTATSLVVIEQKAGEVRSFIGTAGVTAKDRTELKFTSLTPKPSVSTPGGFTQGRASVTVSVPKILANTNRTINTGSISLAFDPETTVAEVAALKSVLINALIDADFDQLWLNQSLD